MQRKTLNLGILAHVDAGKTTLTERLLYAAGVIDAVGSVDDGTTQTDSLELEQQRGITIKSAVVSFAIGDIGINLIDTPGHPDFIAEVERVLSVLDGVVLVISAVEGVQPQTRVLMRALERLKLPTLMFVNKADRRGADCDRVLSEIGEKLTSKAIAMGAVRREGTPEVSWRAHAEGDDGFAARLVELLVEQDDSLLADFVEDEAGVSSRRLQDELAAQSRRALVHPVFYGSARTGAGVDAVRAGIAELLPAAAGDEHAPLSAAVFKVERGAAGEKVAYARAFSGTISVRDRVRVRRDGLEEPEEEKVTAIAVFDGGTSISSSSVGAGHIGKIWGLGGVQIGDTIGRRGPRAPAGSSFAPPTLESVVAARDEGDRAALYAALSQLGEQDPLIDVRRDDDRGEIAVSLYGEVQKEVIEATLASDFGVVAVFHETTTIHIERPRRRGEAVEVLFSETNPFLATIGLRVDPAPSGSGVEFRFDLDPRLLPIYIYKTAESFGEVMTQHIRRALREGLFGWHVTDCFVAMTDCDYYVGDGSTRGGGDRHHGHSSRTSASDFRKLTPVVLMRALADAGTVVCEPTDSVVLEIPTVAMGMVLPVLARLGAKPDTPSVRGELSVIQAVLPSARVGDLHRELPRLTGGEGVLESAFSGYEPVSGDQPTRPRRTPNPLNIDEYLLHLEHRT